jgi:hypothetical protein
MYTARAPPRHQSIHQHPHAVAIAPARPRSPPPPGPRSPSAAMAKTPAKVKASPAKKAVAKKAVAAKKTVATKKAATPKKATPAKASCLPDRWARRAPPQPLRRPGGLDSARDCCGCRSAGQRAMRGSRAALRPAALAPCRWSPGWAGLPCRGTPAAPARGCGRGPRRGAMLGAAGCLRRPQCAPRPRPGRALAGLHFPGQGGPRSGPPPVRMHFLAPTVDRLP